MRVPTVTIRRHVLESWLVIEDFTRAHLADELGVTRGRVSQLLSAQAEPSAHLIAKLLLRTRLPFHRLFQVVGKAQRGTPAVRGRRAGRAGSRAAAPVQALLAA